MKCYAFISGVVIAACSAPPTRADDFADRCRAAVEKSLPLITASAEKYTQERKCFSCHHQALPGMTVSHLAWRGYGNDFEKYRQQLNFTVDYFEKRREQIVEGKGIPGGAYSAGYALQLISGYYPEGRAKDVGRDLIKYLIKQQRSDGSW